MGFRERLQVILDVDANGANTGLKGFISNFRTSIAQAEGGIGKFKAGVGAAGTAFGNFITSPAGIAAGAGLLLSCATPPTACTAPRRSQRRPTSTCDVGIGADVGFVRCAGRAFERGAIALHAPGDRRARDRAGAIGRWR